MSHAESRQWAQSCFDVCVADGGKEFYLQDDFNPVDVADTELSYWAEDQ